MLADRLLRLVEVVEQRALVEALGLGGVDVLGLVVAERAAAEADQAARGVADWKHQTIAEPVVGLAAAVGIRHQAGGE